MMFDSHVSGSTPRAALKPILWVFLVAAAMLSWGDTVGAKPPAEGQAAQASAGRVFGSDAGMMFNSIKPDKTGDFEAVLAKVKEALQKSAKPERKQQAASWRVFKALEPGARGAYPDVLQEIPWRHDSRRSGLVPC